METTICLNMIVKNESHIITKTLNNLCSYINYIGNPKKIIKPVSTFS